MDNKLLKKNLEEYLRKMLGKALKLDPARIDCHEYIDLYGINSITIMDLTVQLENIYGKISKSLFYEYKTISELAGYFSENYKEISEKLFCDESSKTSLSADILGDDNEETSANTNEEVITHKFDKYISHCSDKKEVVSELSDRSKDIAIIGISGEYPKASDIDEFWKILYEAKDCISKIPEERNWDTSGFMPGCKDIEGAVYSEWGGFIDDYDCFDSAFFNISPREAKMMDPQERRFLQTVWHLTEDAGYTKSMLNKYTIGVFAGVMYNEYQLLGSQLKDGKSGVPLSSHSSVANRISYFFNFKGPSIAVDTMCSSALTAIYLAIKSIRNGECEIAVAGGVNLSLTTYKYLVLSHGKFASVDGRCRSFGEGGDGYVPGEGVGAVMLKSLDKAIEDGDNIYAVIKGAAVNHNGRTTGYFVPDPAAQGSVIAKALKDSDISSDMISYVEAHGTGTALGDPIEINGLIKGFSDKKRETDCYVGSVKSNIGHLESAAGIAALTKVVLQMKYGKIVRSLHSDVINKNIDLSGTHFIIPQHNIEWLPFMIDENGKAINIPRIAGISSFGAGGSNAHIIISEYKGKEEIVYKKKGDYIFVLSAKNEERIQEYVKRMYDYLKGVHRTLTDDNNGGRLQEIISDISAIAKTLLNISDEDFHLNESFTELGMDQYTLTRFNDCIKKKYINYEAGSANYTVNDVSSYILKLEKNNSDINIDNDGSFERMIYTLQTGREMMNERLAIICSSENNLIESLEACIKSWRHEEKLGTRIFHGNSSTDKTSISDIIDDDIVCDMASRWIKNNEIEKIASIWVKGFDIDFSSLYDYNKYVKISLPQYPFQRKKYWFDVDEKNCQAKDAQKLALNNNVILEEKVISNATQKNNISEKIKSDINISMKNKLSIDEVKERIVKIIADTLEIGIDDFDTEQAFNEFGIDSVMSVEVVNKINSIFKIELRSTDLFNYPSIHALAEHVSKIIPEDDYIIEDNNFDGTKELSIQVNNTTTIKDNKYQKGKIAIIGMSAKMPEADSVEEFWNNLSNGVCSVGEVKRWEKLDFYSPDKNDSSKSYCKNMGTMNRISGFDPLFFNISPKEAQFMDPQQRIVLMEAWKAIEDAGYSNNDLENRRVGVFIGCGSSDYSDCIKSSNVKPEAYSFMGNDMSILAARISYFMNLKGPSIAVNTACSSSLVAINEACESIWAGTSEIAIAGGVSVLPVPNLHIMASRAGMLSENGYCRAFDNDADGFVPGEGAGIVLLKLYDEAVKDNDHIYGVIDGIKVNQDGRTNGITAPNGLAQAELEEEVYFENNISPETITYVEAHGTGTKLGDPIEVNALKDSFGKFTDKKEFCAIGSVKSNIGHTLTAAGIASLIKVLLCIKNKKIPPTLFVDKLNEHIDFKNSPFYVASQLKSWAPNNVRRAAISSFGFSGTNAHMVVSEVNNSIIADMNENTPVLFVMSAKNIWSLNKKKEDILSWAKREKNNFNLKDAAYTLLNGRTHFEFRSAFVVSSWDELINVLSSDKAIDTFKDSTGFRKKISDINDINSIISVLHSNKDDKLLYKKLALYYEMGYDLEICKLYSGKYAHRISMPVYPFFLNDYWFDTPVANLDKSQCITVSKCLEQENYKLVMNRNGEKFEKELYATDSFLNDHVVNNNHIMPGVAYLEMIYVTLKSEYRNANISFENIYWLRALNVIDSKKIVLKTDNESKFEVCDSENESLVYLKGSYSIEPVSEEVIDRKWDCFDFPDTLYGTDIYRGLETNGLKYGRSFRAIKRIVSNSEKAVGMLSLEPDFVDAEYFMIPGILDAALQTIAGIKYSIKDSSVQTFLPFSVDKVSIMDKVSNECTAYVETSGQNIYNIKITDNTGRVLVSLNGLYMKQVGGAKKLSENKLNLDFNYSYIWKKNDYLRLNESQLNYGKTLVIYKDDQDVIEKYFSGRNECVLAKQANETVRISDEKWLLNIDKVDDINAFFDSNEYLFANIYFFLGLSANSSNLDYNNIINNEENAVLSFFHLLQSLNRIKLNRKIRITVVVKDTFKVLDNDNINLGGACLNGMVKSAAKEFSKFDIVYVDTVSDDYSDEQSCDKIIKMIECVPSNENGDEYAIRYGVAYERKIIPIELKQGKNVLLKKNGVYLIVGGAGGIGSEFAKYIARNYNAKIALIGRSQFDDRKGKLVNEISTLGGEALYVQADATDYDSMCEAGKKIINKFGKINGIIHSAIVLKDKMLNNMTEEMLEAALAPKVAGSVNMYRAFENTEIDFYLFFSSIQSFTGNAGQANYAAGCSFVDVFASYLNQKTNANVKVLNWGYWGTVGVVSDEYYSKSLSKLGIKSIDVDEGMVIAKRMINSPYKQILSFKVSDDLKEKMNIDSSKILIQNQKISDICLADFAGVNSNLEISQTEIDSIIENFAILGDFSVKMLEKAFSEMNILTIMHKEYTVNEICEKSGICTKFYRLIPSLLDILVRVGDLENTNGGYRRIKALPQLPDWDELEDQKNDLAKNHSYISNHAELIFKCCKNYKSILTGKMIAQDVLFHKASMDEVGGIYTGNDLADYYNSYVAWLTESYIKLALEKGEQKIRIVEIGAGTGGTTRGVLGAIEKYHNNIEYLYTDISALFLKYGKKVFGEKYDFVDFGILDIEKDAAEYDCHKGKFDILIATNVLHATKNMNVTIEHAKKLLKTNGCILINEATQYSDYSTMTFGLLDGWWQYEDSENRIKNSPLLSPEKWKSVLSVQGFYDFRMFGTRELGQSVIAAVSNGLCFENANEIELDQANDIEEIAPYEVFEIAENNSTGIQNISTDENTERNKINKIIEIIHDGMKCALNLNKEEINDNKEFSSYGVDSISGVEIVDYINNQLNIVMKTTVLFDCVTVMQLAEHIYSEYDDVISCKNEHREIVDESLYDDLDEELLKQLEDGTISVDDAINFWR